MKTQSKIRKQLSSPWERSRAAFQSIHLVSTGGREEKKYISVLFTHQMFPLNNHSQESSACVDDNHSWDWGLRSYRRKFLVEGGLHLKPVAAIGHGTLALGLEVPPCCISHWLQATPIALPSPRSPLLWLTAADWAGTLSYSWDPIFLLLDLILRKA